MNPEGELKEKMQDAGISFGPGRVDSVDFDEYGMANWLTGAEAIKDISGGNLAEAKKRLAVNGDATTEELQAGLDEQLLVFRFSFDAWMDSYGAKDPGVPLTWISNGTSFEDDFHRSAWILAGCGVLQASGLVCEGFDIPTDLS